MRWPWSRKPGYEDVASYLYGYPFDDSLVREAFAVKEVPVMQETPVVKEIPAIDIDAIVSTVCEGEDNDWCYVCFVVSTCHKMYTTKEPMYIESLEGDLIDVAIRASLWGFNRESDDGDYDRILGLLDKNLVKFCSEKYDNEFIMGLVNTICALDYDERAPIRDSQHMISGPQLKTFCSSLMGEYTRIYKEYKDECGYRDEY